MRNRPDISYLTILGLSLTVVIAMQKGDNCEDSVRFKLSDADGHHICFLSVDAVRDAFLAVAHEKSSFVFGYTPSCPALSSPGKVFVDVNGLGLNGAILPRVDAEQYFLTKHNIPDSCCALMPLAPALNGPINTRFNLVLQNDFHLSSHLSAFPVRAGPEWTT